jgi:hypothetical protein
VKVQGQRGGAFLERLPEQIDSANDHWHGRRNSLTATPLSAGLGWVHFWHRIPRNHLRENSTLSQAGRVGR